MARRGRRAVKTELSTAFHEAGHAVSALELGQAIRYADIVPNEEANRLGVVVYTDRGPNLLKQISLGHMPTPAEERFLRQLALSTACGHEAERQYRNGKASLGGATSDRHRIVGYLSAIGYDDVEIGHYAKILASQARALVARRWDAITAVALALFERRKLYAREIRAIVYDVEVTPILAETEALLERMGLSPDKLRTRPAPHVRLQFPLPAPVPEPLPVAARALPVFLEDVQGRLVFVHMTGRTIELGEEHELEGPLDTAFSFGHRQPRRIWTEAV
jgi:hypothetical protein